MKLTTHFHLVPKLGMSGAIHPFRHMTSYLLQENLYGRYIIIIMYINVTCVFVCVCVFV